jgi:hypothetical protein
MRVLWLAFPLLVLGFLQLLLSFLVVVVVVVVIYG